MRSFFRLVLLLALVAAAVDYFYFAQPYGPATETFVDIPAGTGTAGIAARLEQAGIIRSRYAFEALRQLKGGTLHAGEYRFDHPATARDVYARIVRGDVYTRTLLIPEGYNIFDIAQAVQAAGLGDAQAFLAAEKQQHAADRRPEPARACRSRASCSPTPTGSARTPPRQRCWPPWSSASARRPARLGLTAEPGLVRIVTLASIVEKEVGVASERATVAGIFTNRLALGMPLQTDPTVVYAALLAGRWRGTIYQSDLQSDSAYNTYRHTGLPPGPIANPGEAALKAALAPAATDYLYFVADAQGHTQFSADLKQHAAQVAAYRAAAGK